MLRVLFVPATILLVGGAAYAVLLTAFDFDAARLDHWDWAVSYTLEYKSPPAFLAPAFLGTAFALIALLLTGQIVFSRVGGDTRHGGRDAKSLHGSAKWALKKDVKEAGLLVDHGVQVGGWPKGKSVIPLCHNGPENMIVFAPPRSGKGAGVVVPTLFTWKDSAIVLDIRGENWGLTSGWRAEQGHKILKFDPTSESGSIRFNPLAEVRLGTDYEVQDAMNIAMMIVDPDGKGLADFWAKSGFAWQSASVLYTLYKIKRDEGRVASLKDVDTILTAVDEGGLEDLINDMIAFDTGLAGSTELIRGAAGDMKNRAANERSGVQSSAKVDLALYRDPIIAKNISESDFTLDELMNGDQPSTLYLVVPPSDINRLRPLLRIFMTLVQARLMKNDEKTGKAKFKYRLLMMLDEFTALGKLDNFVTAMAFSSGFGVKVCLVIQDLKQLQAVYGRENGILGTVHIRVAYAPTDVETAKLLSDMCGKTTIVQHRTTVSRSSLAVSGQVSESLAEVARPLLTPDECMQLPSAQKSRIDPAKIVKPGAVLIFAAGHPAIFGRQALYFLNPEFLKRSRIPPVSGVPARTPGQASGMGASPDPILAAATARITAIVNS